MEDTTQIILDSIDDSQNAQVLSSDASTETPTEAPVEASTEGSTPDPSTETPADPTEDVLRSSSDQAGIVEDEFAKKHGLAPQRPGERENRLPYSAVKRIVANAEKKALEPLTRKVTEFEAKVTDYEGRLQRVAQFEQIMTTDPVQFLNMLAAKIPAYRQLFDSMSGRQGQSQGQGQPQTKPADPNDGMPQPDVTLQDGSKVYSMDGLAALNKWNREQAKREIEAEFGKRLKPFEEERAAREREAALAPQIDRMINEARTWPQFKENEEAITKALQANRSLSLEGAYRQVVMGKLSTDYNSMRAKVLAELKTAPAPTSAGGGGTKPTPQQPSGPRTTEQIILDSIRNLPGR